MQKGMDDEAPGLGWLTLSQEQRRLSVGQESMLLHGGQVRPPLFI